MMADGVRSGATMSNAAARIVDPQRRDQRAQPGAALHRVGFLERRAGCGSFEVR